MVTIEAKVVAMETVKINRILTYFEYQIHKF